MRKSIAGGLTILAMTLVALGTRYEGSRPADGTSRLVLGGIYPRISPDGTRFAYYFYVQTSYDDLENNIRWIDTGSYATWTWADHFTGPADESEYLFYLTADELKQLNREISYLLLPRFRGRLADPSLRPAGSVPVEMLMFSFPLNPPDAESDSAASADNAASADSAASAGAATPTDSEPPSGGAG